MKKVLIIVFLGLLTYGSILFNGFVWDDEVMFQKLGGISSEVYFRPVISAVYSTIYHIFGASPFFFHFFQLVFHIAAAVLIYFLFKRFFKESLALILALIFLVHPANVEAISFASAMQEVTFTLTGIIGLSIFFSSENPSLIKIILATIILLLALLMKETAIVFFALVFVFLVLFKRKRRQVLLIYSVISALLLLGYFIFRFSGGHNYVQGPGLFPIMRVPLIVRLINMPSIVVYYLGKFFIPYNLVIAQNWVINTANLNNFFLPLIFVILLFSAASIYMIKRKDKVFVFFFLWFLLGLLPHLQLIPLNMTVAERWLYFPMIGLLGVIGNVIEQLKIKSEKLRIIFFSLAVIIISIFAVRSFIRTLDWRNGLSLFSHDIRRDSSFDLQNNMGVELFRIGRYDEAKKYFEISTQLAPYWWVNWNNLGAVYEREKNIQKAAEYYKRSIDNGQYYLAYENLAKILVLYGKDKNQTEVFLKKALEIFPDDENLQQISAYYLQQINKKSYN